MTILVVDDDKGILLYLKTALSKSGYDVITASRAREGLDVLATTRVNLIISDMSMPGMTGAEFCEIVRQDESVEYIPIILLSAHSSVDDFATGIVAGADDYLTKPIRLNDLLAKIQEYAM